MVCRRSEVVISPWQLIAATPPCQLDSAPLHLAAGFRPIKIQKNSSFRASTASCFSVFLHGSMLYTLNLNNITSPSFTT